MFLCSNLSVFAMETTSTTSSTCNIYNDVESSGARIVHNYKKTITKVYKSRSSIPDSINYSEYNNSLKGTFSGRLYLKSIFDVSSTNSKYDFLTSSPLYIYNNIVLPQTGSL